MENRVRETGPNAVRGLVRVTGLEASWPSYTGRIAPRPVVDRVSRAFQVPARQLARCPERRRGFEASRRITSLGRKRVFLLPSYPGFVPGIFDRIFGVRKRRPIRVVMDSEVLDDVLGAASSSSPREFGALLEGDIQGNTLRITGYVMPHFLSGEGSVLMDIGLLPMTTQTVGSIHSHPMGSPTPSEADIRFFGRNGLVHFIVASPYSRASVKGYDRWGREVEFAVE